MSTTPRSAEAIMTIYVWGPTVEEAMAEAKEWEKDGWIIAGIPAPMIWKDQHGSGISLSREIYRDGNFD